MSLSSQGGLLLDSRHRKHDVIIGSSQTDVKTVSGRAADSPFDGSQRPITNRYANVENLSRAINKRVTDSSD